MDNFNIAYAAGLFDGEGCITVKRSVSHGTITRSLNVRVEMACKPVLDYLAAGFDGEVKISPSKRDSGYKPVYRLEFRSQKAKDVLNLLIPYLIEKRDQAIVALAYPITSRGHKHNGAAKELQEEIYWALREMKR